ncbi:MAG: hypothetical protein WCH31_01015 [Actinomycetes bacterium]
MSNRGLRAILIGLLAAAAGLNVAGNKSGQGWLVALSFTCFFIAASLILGARRRARASVFAREEKTGADADRARSDQ